MGCGGSNMRIAAYAPSILGGQKSGEPDFKPIHSAIRWNKNIDEVTTLVKNKALANIEDPGNGNRPIHIAGQNGHLNIVEFLIKKGADVNAKNLKGNTAFHMALEYDYYPVCLKLIEAGADLNIVNDLGFPANKGIEGTKSLSLLAFSVATTTEEALKTLEECRKNIKEIEKSSYVSTGLKVKKTLNNLWTNEVQNTFKDILNLL